ncbi:hypothetical protein HGO40_23825 [Pseudomonas sp. CG7]|uniref:hypothetical protein n=1 Tax=Pseudomonas sp. CG7 TaxID=191007 RepID=UPI002033597C|nr:hypothetical protein [Pseudomonas sp. CG7]MCM2463461.1 hypothetical protein [Pseudomonas sp. CG7]
MIASLFDRLNQNQLALGAAVEELSNWVEQRGSADIATNVRAALENPDDNLVFIRQGIAELTVAGSLGQG